MRALPPQGHVFALVAPSLVAHGAEKAVAVGAHLLDPEAELAELVFKLGVVAAVAHARLWTRHAAARRTRARVEEEERREGERERKRGRGREGERRVRRVRRGTRQRCTTVTRGGRRAGQGSRRLFHTPARTREAPPCLPDLPSFLDVPPVLDDPEPLPCPPVGPLWPLGICRKTCSEGL